MLFFMTDRAKQLPIAPVRRVVFVVVIFVVNREFAESFAGELSAAPPTYMRKNLEGLFPIGILATFCAAPSLGNDCTESAAVGTRLSR